MQRTLGNEVARKVVKLIMAVVGLGVIRGILGALPMLKNAAPLGETLVTPLILSKAIADTLILVALMAFGIRVGTLFHRWYARAPAIGTSIILVTSTLVAIIAYAAYDDLFGALVPGQSALYGWIFLALIVAPIVWVGILVFKNMDAIIELLFRKSRASENFNVSVGTCSCGYRLEAGAVFCTECGKPVMSATSAQPQRRCASCGAPVGTKKFCSQCGAPTGSQAVGAGND